MTLEEVIASIPDDWTAWELRSRRRRTAFVATLSRLTVDDDIDGGTEYVTGHGSTPIEAFQAALAKVKETA